MATLNPLFIWFSKIKIIGQNKNNIKFGELIVALKPFNMLKIQKSNLQSFCRTCLQQLQSTSESSFNTCVNINQTPNITKLLIISTSLNINEDMDSVYPQYLCDKCYGTIQQFDEFRNMALQSDEVLRKIIEENVPNVDGSFCNDNGDLVNPEPEIKMEFHIEYLDNNVHNETTAATDYFANDSDSSTPTTSTAKKRKFEDNTDLKKFPCKIKGCDAEFNVMQSFEDHVALHHPVENDVSQQLTIINKNLSEVQRENKHSKAMMTSLIEEMSYLRKELLKKIPNNSAVISNSPKIPKPCLPTTTQKIAKPCLPTTIQKSFLPKNKYKALDKFFAFEADLRDEVKFNDLVNEFSEISAKDSHDFIRKCWSQVVSDETATNFSWRGMKNKEKANNLATAAAVKAAFKEIYPNEPVETVNEISRRFFTYAQDRINKRKIRSTHPSKYRGSAAKF